MIKAHANDTFTHSYNVTLSNTLSWTAQTHVISTDYRCIMANLVANTPSDVGWITSTLSSVNTNLPNAWNNFNLTISANSQQMQYFYANGVNVSDRVVIIQTSFTSNTGIVEHAKDLYLRVLNSTV